MSLKYRDVNGVETSIAGMNGLSGELVPSVSYYQKGNFTITSQASGAVKNNAVTFSTPMPDADYVVVATTSQGAECRLDVRGKTTTGFNIQTYNMSSNTAPTVTVQWQAFKLMTDESRVLDEAAIEQNAADIEDLQDDKQDKTLETPLTIGGASRTTVEDALGGLNEVVPSGASTSNKLVTQNNLPKKKTGTISSGSTGNNSISETGYAGGTLVLFEGNNYGHGVFLVSSGWSGNSGYVTKLAGSATVDVSCDSVTQGVPSLTISTVNMTNNQTVSYTIREL